MTPEQTNELYQGLPEGMRKRLERIAKCFRFAASADRGYVLSDEVTKDLASKAKPGCYKCQGTGIKDWRAQGLKARVCKCAQV